MSCVSAFGIYKNYDGQGLYGKGALATG